MPDSVVCTRDMVLGKTKSLFSWNPILDGETGSKHKPIKAKNIE